MKPFFSSHRREQTQGVALVLTLSLVVLLSALVVGFTLTARFDRALSSGYAKADRTELVAFSALNHAKALLASNIPDVGPNAPTTPTHWWVAPGRLWTQSGNAAPTVIDLYSGDSTSANDPNLNRRRTDGTYPIEPNGVPMRVAWIPVGKDPSLPVSATNPIVARFAYWIDVENTRINLRTARRGNGTRSELAPANSTYVPAVNRRTAFTPAGSASGGLAPGSPGVVDISGLTGATNVTGLPDPTVNMQISNSREYRQFFASDALWKTFFNANQFDISVAGESPEFTPLGKNRMSSVQFRNKSLPGFQFYWDLDDPNQLMAEPMTMQGNAYPPGTGLAVDEYAYYKHSVRALAAAYQSTEWPGYSGASLATKWAIRAGLPASDSAKVAEQVAWNMLTNHAFLLAGRGDITRELFGLGVRGRTAAGTTGDSSAVGDLYPSVFTPSTGGRYLGQSGNPYVSELGLELTWETTPNKNLRLKLVGELFTGSKVNIANVASTSEEDQGVQITGTYLVPTAASFEIPATSTTITPGTTVRGWTTAANGSNIVFTFSKPNPFGANWTSATGLHGGLSAEPMGSATYLKAGGYQVFRTVQNTTSASNDPCLVIPLNPSITSVTISDVKVKVLAVKQPNSNGYRIFQYCPLQDTSMNAGTLLATTPQSAAISLGSMTLTAGDPSRAFTAEVSDPRRCALSDAWAVCSAAGTTLPGTNTLGLVNSSWPAVLPEIRSLALIGLPSETGYYINNPGDQGTVYSPGQFANLWTAPPYIVPATGDLYLNLTSSDTGIPDHLALELINAEPGMALGCNQGTINPNTWIYPTSWGIPARTKALDALFRRWKIGGTNVNSTALDSSIATNMPPDGYKYRGELIPYLETGGGVLDNDATKWEKQALFSALAGRLSTQSSTFGVWGVAQTVQQTPGGQILVTGEKRFYGVIRRRPYFGIDGVNGNAKSNSSGAFTETITGGGGFTGPLFGLMRDTFDGPDPVPVPNPASVPVPDETSASQTVRASYNPLKTYLVNETAYLEYLEP